MDTNWGKVAIHFGSGSVTRANYGAEVVGPWVFGLIERTPNGKRDIRTFYVNKRDRLTLQPLVEANILPGTRVHSDQWAAYASLSEGEADMSTTP
jgi:hypothetical protein